MALHKPKARNRLEHQERKEEMAKKLAPRKLRSKENAAENPIEKIVGTPDKMGTVTLRFGDAVRGKGPESVIEFDFPSPYVERGGVPNAEGNFHNPPHFFDLYHLVTLRYPNGVSWRTLRDELKGWGLKQYKKSRALIERNAQKELLSEELYITIDDEQSPDGKRYIRVMALDDFVGKDGGGQILETSLILFCWLLSFNEEEESDENDFGSQLIGVLYDRNAQFVDVWGGLTGSVGSGALLVIPDFLRSHGYPSVTSYACLSHLESLQVRGVVRQHIVERAAAMQRIVSDMVILLGQPRQDEEDVTIFDSVAHTSPYVRARHANALTVAREKKSSPTMVVWYAANDPTLPDRWVGVQITRAPQISGEYAREILERELRAGSIRYGRPDGLGRFPIVPVNRKLMRPDRLKDLIPVLLYLRENDVVLHSTKKSWGKTKDVEIRLFGEGLIDEILEKLGTDLIQLTTNGSRVVALSTLERWIMIQYHDLTFEEIEATLSDPEHWTQLCWLFGSAFIGENTTINTKLFTIGDGVCVLVGHPIMFEEELAVLACRTISDEVEDPFAPIRAKRKAEKEATEAERIAREKAKAKAEAVRRRKKGSGK